MTNPLSAKLGLDVTDFKANVVKINREMRLVTSEFKASSAGLSDWANEADGMEMRVGSLTKKIDLQALKVENLNEQYAETVAKSGETSAAAKNLEIRLNNERATLAKMNNELGESNDRLEELQKEEKGADKSTKSLTGSLKKMLSGLKKIGPGVAGAIKGMGKLAASAAKTAARVAVGMAKIAAAVAVGMGALAASTIGPASDLDETMSKVQVVFGAAAESVLAFGDDAATALGMSKNEALAATGVYGNLLKAMGFTDDASADMSTSLVTLAGDLASFNNMDPTEVLDKLRAGLTGETEPLKTLGINMNQARLKAKALEMGLIAQGEELTAAAKAQAAYTIMLEDTALAQGDFARTSGGLANQQRILAANVENAKSKIGAGLLPVVTQLVTALNSFLQSDTAQAGIGRITEWLGGLGESLKELLSGGLGADIDIGTMIGDMLSKGLSNKGKIIEIGLNIVTSLLEGITEAIPQLATVALSILTSLVEFITTALPALVDAAIPLLMTLISGILDALPLLAEAAIHIIIALALGLAAALPELIPTIVDVMLKILQVILDNLPLILDAAIQIIGALIEGIILAIPTLVAALPAIIQAILNVIGPDKMIKLMWDVGKGIVTGVWEGIKQAGPQLMADIKSFFDGLIDTAKEAIGYGSPARMFFPVGGSMPDGVGVGVDKRMPALKKKLQSAMGGLAQNINLNANANLTGSASGGLAMAGAGGVNFGDIIINVPGTNASPQQIGTSVKNGLLDAMRAKGQL
jgi:hypothetical protein